MLYRALSSFVLAIFLLLLATPPPSIQAQQQCTFVLGFQAIHQMIPSVVGDCVTNEFHNPETGDGLQLTANGLLVWRKADNWTAFTDGYRTWVNGPFGLQTRLNTQRFDWERDRQTATVQLFFSRNPESMNDFTAVFPVQRQVQYSDQRIATATLEALIAGPTAAEQAQGFFSELGGMLTGPSNCEGDDFRVTIQAGGVAEVRFCRQVVSAGIGQDARVMNQIQATLTQFGTVDRVRLLTREGNCLFDQSGLNLCLQ
jgi:predicted Rdx family selenoprotein